MSEVMMVNGEIIKQVREILRKDAKGMSARSVQLITLALVADLYEKQEGDHVKIQELYPAYKIGRWLVGAIGLISISDFFTRVFNMIGK